MDVIIEYGEFFKQLAPYLEVFLIENFVFFDGGGIIENPEREFEFIESFFGVRHELKFKFNNTKGLGYKISAARVLVKI